MTGDARSRPVPADPSGDAELHRRLRAGEPSAFEDLVAATSPRLLATLRRMLRRDEDAEDALQEAFLAAFRHLDSFEGQSRLSTWLHRIAVNVALMRLRSQRRRPETSLDELLPRFAEDGHRIVDPPAPARSPEEALDEHARRAAVRRCIDALPEPHRTILVLRDLEDLDTEEAARALGVSADAAKMRLHRARQALRTLLEREGLLAGDRQGAAPPAARRVSGGARAD